MNREIKFRAWDGKDYMSKPFTIYDVQLSRIGFTKEAILMQYTGLKDKNGKEIYEGDILKSPYPNCKNIEIKWMTGGCCNFVATGWDWDQDCIKNFEVIGNIYENPELI